MSEIGSEQRLLGIGKFQEWMVLHRKRVIVGVLAVITVTIIRFGLNESLADAVVEDN